MKPGQIVFKEERNGEHLLIRSIEIGDAVAMREYINTLSNEETFIAMQRDQFSLDEEKKAVEGLVRSVIKNKAVFLLFFINEKLNGVVDVQISSKGAIKHRGSLGITLAQDARGKGFGNLLMSTVIAEARKNIQGLKLIQLSLFSGNDVALTMYKKYGFVEYGRLPKGLKRKEELHDEILMFKELTS